MPSSGSLKPCFRSSEVSSSTTCSPFLMWISAGEYSNFFAVILMTLGGDASAAEARDRQLERQDEAQATTRSSHPGPLHVVLLERESPVGVLATTSTSR